MPPTFEAEQRKLSGMSSILPGNIVNDEPGGSRRTAKVDGIGLAPLALPTSFVTATVCRVRSRHLFGEA